MAHESASVMADQHEDQWKHSGFHGDEKALVLCGVAALRARQISTGVQKHTHENSGAQSARKCAFSTPLSQNRL